MVKLFLDRFFVDLGGQVGAKLEPSWLIQGFKMVCESYFNVKLIFYRKM